MSSGAPLNGFTAAATISMSAVFLAVIPLALVIAGAVVTITRRRK